MQTEFRGSEKSNLDAGAIREAGDLGDERSEAPMEMMMEMATAATSIAMETSGGSIFKPTERNENRKQRKRSEAPVAPRDWMSRMER